MFIFNLILIFFFAVSANAAEREAKPGSYLVKCKKGASDSELAALHQKAHAVVIKKFFIPVGLYLIQVDAGASFEEAENLYRSDPLVDYIEPNYDTHVQAQVNDPLFPIQWALGPRGVNIESAWSKTMGDRSIVVGLIDTGIDYTHPDLYRNIWKNSLEIPGNGVDDDKNGYIDDIYGINAITGSGDPMDDNDHGTHMAGIIGAEGNNQIGISGVSPKVSIAACKFMNADGKGDIASAITCLNYFAELADRSIEPVTIIATNNSWVAGYRPSEAFFAALKEHQKRGILFIAAANTRGNNNDILPVYPANLTLSNVISVTAHDADGKVLQGANIGKRSVHVAAPGADIISTVAQGKYAYLSGTSTATAHVSGAAALLKASDTSLDWISIKNLLIDSGKPLTDKEMKTLSGRQIRMWDSSGFGALTCKDQTINARLKPVGDIIVMKLGESLALSVIDINCAHASAKTLLTVLQGPTNSSIRIGLNDQGEKGDDWPNDGVFNGQFTPVAKGKYQLHFPTSFDKKVLVTVTN
ncbi:MAG: S8 family peptidase [Myxococcota bacterium]